VGKVVFWLVVFFAVLFVLRLINVASSRARGGDASGRPPKAKDGAMIRCVECGVYLPSADAIQGPRGPLCGDPQCAHRRPGSGG
jgi:hypothetical protein